MSNILCVRVLYFGIAQEIMGKKEELLMINEGETLAHLIQRIYLQHDQLQSYAPYFRWALNQKICQDESVILKNLDCIALIPPMSGG